MNISSDKHLNSDIHCITKDIVKKMLSMNRMLEKSHVKNFVNKIIYSKYFLTNENAYHNLQHTFEVFQMSTHLLNLYPRDHFTRSQRTLVQIAALCHDYGHNGVPNSQWNVEDIHKQQRAMIRNDSDLSDIILACATNSSVHSENSSNEITSYNEIMHIKKTILLIMRYKNVFFPRDSSFYVKSVISTLILATDLSQHKTYMNMLNTEYDTMADMILILKLADISHSLRPFKVHLYWVYKLRTESNNTETPPVEYMANDTLSFMRTFVQPLLKCFIERNPKASSLMRQLETNKQIWKTHLKNSSTCMSS